MEKETIHVDGEDIEVREDTAKSYRGVMWILGTVLIFVAIAAVLLFSGILYSASDGEINKPETRTGEPIN